MMTIKISSLFSIQRWSLGAQKLLKNTSTLTSKLGSPPFILSHNPVIYFYCINPISNYIPRVGDVDNV